MRIDRALTPAAAAIAAWSLVTVLLLASFACQPAWRSYTAPGGEFTVLMPEEPAIDVWKGDPRRGFSKVTLYAALTFSSPPSLDEPPNWQRNVQTLWDSMEVQLSNRQGVYLIQIAELDSPEITADESLRRYRDWLMRVVPLQEGEWGCTPTLLHERAVTLGQHPGVDMAVEQECFYGGAEDESHLSRLRARFYRVGSQLYIQQVYSGAPNIDESDTADAQRFFDSLRIH